MYKQTIVKRDCPAGGSKSPASGWSRIKGVIPVSPTGEDRHRQGQATFFLHLPVSRWIIAEMKNESLQTLRRLVSVTSQADSTASTPCFADQADGSPARVEPKAKIAKAARRFANKRAAFRKTECLPQGNPLCVFRLIFAWCVSKGFCAPQCLLAPPRTAHCTWKELR